MQGLVAKYPELIGDSDGSLLLIRREQPIPDSADTSGRWSLDHLFVTRDGVPVLVELKRAVDTRLRREVVGQMLDYAANGVAFWQTGSIARAFENTCIGAGVDPLTSLAEFLGDSDPSMFWQQVDANFSAGRIKLVFVADVIPRELARVVEFLNEQMRADVRAVELKWYLDDAGGTTLVPRIIGETERASAQKAVARESLSSISMEEWIAKNIGPKGADAVAGSEAFVAMITRLGGEAIVANTQGSIVGSFLTLSGKPVYPLHLWADGKISISFKFLLKRPQLLGEASRRSLYDQLAQVVGGLSTQNLGGFPSFKVSLLSVASTLDAVMPVARRVVEAAIADE